MTRWQVAAKQAKKLRRWAFRLIAFYFGYKILHREIYGADEVDPIVLALGLWLCGIAPADIFDGLRKVGDKVTGEKSSAVSITEEPKPAGSTGNGEAA